MSDLGKVAKLLANLSNQMDVDGGEFDAALRVIHDAIISKELKRRPSELH